MANYVPISFDLFEPYFESGMITCPFCGSKDIEASGNAHVGYLEVFQHVGCHTCDKEWLDIYKIDRVEEVVLGPEDQ